MVSYTPSIGASICQDMVRYMGYVNNQVQVLYPVVLQPPGEDAQRRNPDSGISVSKFWSWIPKINTKGLHERRPEVSNKPTGSEKYMKP